MNVFKAQSVFNYGLLSCVFIPWWLIKMGGKQELLTILRKSGIFYFLVALADVEANYFIIKAYKYTLVTTIQVNSSFFVVDLAQWKKINLSFKGDRCVYFADHARIVLFHIKTFLQA